MKRADQPFKFNSQLTLVFSTGVKAADLRQLDDGIRQAADASLYYHTHHFLQQHQYLAPEPPNDFAYWVTNVLQEDRVGERLAAVDTIRFKTIADFRRAVLDILESHLKKNAPARQAPEGEEFHFRRCVLFALPTPYAAWDLAEFAEALRKVSTGCLYNHVFAGRMRPPLGLNDFSYWLETELGEKDLARRIQRLDPYTQTLEGLRSKMIKSVEARLGEPQHAQA